VFWSWIGHGVAESLLCAFIPPLFLENSDPKSGIFNTFWESGAMTFTVVVVIVNLKVPSLPRPLLLTQTDDVSTNEVDGHQLPDLAALGAVLDRRGLLRDLVYYPRL
jgi:hypothetical protein